MIYRNLLLFTLFVINFMELSAKPKEDYGKLSSKILNEYSQELYKKKRYTISSIGGFLTTDVRGITIGYHCKQRVDIDEARRQYVGAMEGIVSKYNSDKKIRPFLHEFPFDHNNFGLSISYDDAKGEPEREPYISYVFSGNETIFFTTTTDGYDRNYVLEEPYSVAVEKVMKEREK